MHVPVRLVLTSHRPLSTLQAGLCGEHKVATLEPSAAKTSTCLRPSFRYGHARHSAFAAVDFILRIKPARVWRRVQELLVAMKEVSP
jgi:hypothetical protein